MNICFIQRWCHHISFHNNIQENVQLRSVMKTIEYK